MLSNKTKAMEKTLLKNVAIVGWVLMHGMRLMTLMNKIIAD